ncbi:zinc finger protein CONSTANS-LIKE 13-like isoform X2 [Oryza brachyantha]|uniref:zinc finger protein CONSTANS-LIKE 13-like isoform X2 n=1 Tax=Oryza brachyantha TaxID=4533 RepID=UPI001ADABA0F|nr:zinc finger protein CONSTANS-LIKE 13-like isoform X2 [Oryza brachyantha]
MAGDEEGAKKAAVAGADGGGDRAAAVGRCDFCGGLPAVVYCRADSARLCLPCDRHVHGANTVSTRHGRAPLCSACRAAPAATRRRGGAAARGLLLCSNCDFDGLRGDAGAGEPPRHDRAAVEGYTGCPSIAELAAILGVLGDYGDKLAGDGGWRSAWEEPQVLSLDDIIVPTTSCHGFQPLLTPSSPETRSSPDGELDGEVLRQLGELAKLEEAAATAQAAFVGAEAAGDQLPSWASPEFTSGHGDFGTEATSHEAPSTTLPSCEHETWIPTDHTDPTDANKMEISCEEVALSSSAEPCLSSFVEVSEILPSLSCSSNGSHDPATPAPTTQALLPKKGVYDIAYPDRGMVISRYKEKRKNRRFDKQIRYESRKARADGRLRIKGRFAKSS